MRRLIVLGVTSLLVAVGLFASATVAAPGSVDSLRSEEMTLASVRALPLAQANPTVSLDVIAAMPVALQQRSDLHIDSSITARTPLITVDGLPVEGQTPDMMAAAATCGSRMIAPLGVWSNPFPSNCGVIGSPNATVTYTVFTDPNVYTTGCFQWKGFSPVYKIPSTVIIGYSESWFGGGCGDGYTTVKWGNVAAVPSGKVVSNGGPAGWAGLYRH